MQINLTRIHDYVRQTFPCYQPCELFSREIMQTRRIPTGNSERPVHNFPETESDPDFFVEDRQSRNRLELWHIVLHPLDPPPSCTFSRGHSTLNRNFRKLHPSPTRVLTI